MFYFYPNEVERFLAAGLIYKKDEGIKWTMIKQMPYSKECGGLTFVRVLRSKP